MTDQENYISKTEIDDVVIIARPQFPDDRGFFREVFRKNDLETATGLSLDFVQSNHSRSTKNTLRGFHAAPWHKLISVPHGDVRAVIADVRKDSPTFGKHITVELGDSNPATLFVPAGCANSYVVLSDIADYNYFVTDYWAPGKEFSVRWNDPTLNVDWKITEPLLSEKDQNNPFLKDLFPEKLTDTK